MYLNIMVPTEGTGFDREAIRVALRLAEKSAAIVHLVRVMKASPLITAAAGTDGVVMAADSITISRDIELSELYMLAAECREMTSAEIVTALEDGPIADALEAYAARISAELVVITSHGRHGLSRLSLGSVTDALIRNVRIPVLVVKPEPSYLNPRAAERIKSIVVPLDGSHLAEQILGPAVELARLEQAEIILLQVLGDKGKESDQEAPVPSWQDLLAPAHAYLNGIAAKLRRAGLSVSADVVIGSSISDSIASFARSHRADLVAIATHGRSGMQRVVRGSVADELTRCAAMSLLVLRPASEVAETKEIRSRRVFTKV